MDMKVDLFQGKIDDLIRNIDNSVIEGDFYKHFFVYLAYVVATKLEKDVEELPAKLYSWSTDLIHRNKKNQEDVKKAYTTTISQFSDNLDLLHDFAKLLMQMDSYYEAYENVCKAYELDNNDLRIEKHLLTIKLNLVPRWQFRMLNDIKRNKAFFEAINSEITAEYCNVLDIGAGCGFLSLAASKSHNTKQIVAIEESPCLTKICNEVVDFENKHIVNGYSTNTEVKTSLSNILVTEVFDTALFGEHVLKTLIHAHENLLEKDFKVVPAAADIYIMAIECAELHQNHTFLKRHIFTLLTDLCIQEDDDPYDAQFIMNYSFRQLTDAYKFITVEFRDLEQLKNLYQVENFIPKFNLSTTASGMVQAFVIWFDLKLGNEKITTNPFDDNCCKCWEQAVIFPKHEFYIKAGESIENIQISTVDDKMELKFDKLINDCDCLITSERVVRFLNDKDLIHNISSIVSCIKVSDLFVLDLLPFPIFGILMAARDNRAFVRNRDRELVHKICQRNDIDEGLITFLNDDELDFVMTLTNRFDIIFFNPVVSIGVVNEHIYANYGLFVNCLKENGVILPKQVDIEFEIVSSKYFSYCQKVEEHELLGPKMPKLMNQFAVNEHWDLEHLNYKSLTETCKSFDLKIDDDEIISSTSLEIIEDGDADAILYWYNINWYNCSYSTKNSLYYNRAAFIIDEPLKVVKGNKVKIDKKQDNGLIKMTCALE